MLNGVCDPYLHMQDNISYLSAMVPNCVQLTITVFERDIQRLELLNALPALQSLRLYIMLDHKTNTAAMWNLFNIVTQRLQHITAIHFNVLAFLEGEEDRSQLEHMKELLSTRNFLYLFIQACCNQIATLQYLHIKVSPSTLIGASEHSRSAIYAAVVPLVHHILHVRNGVRVELTLSKRHITVGSDEEVACDVQKLLLCG